MIIFIIPKNSGLDICNNLELEYSGERIEVRGEDVPFFASNLIKTRNESQVIWETSDLFYFITVLLVKRKVKFLDVEKNLGKRNIIKSENPKPNMGERAK